MKKRIKMIYLPILGLSVFVMSFGGAVKQAQAYSTSYCREYTEDVIIGGRISSAYGTACMQPDGAWKVVSSTGPQGYISTGNVTLGNPVVYQSAPTTVVVREQPVYYAPAPAYYHTYSRPVSSFSINLGSYGKKHHYHGKTHNYRGHNYHRHDGRGHGRNHGHNRGNNRGHRH